MQPYLNQNYFSNTNPAYSQYMQQYQQPNYQQTSFAQNTPYVQNNQNLVGANMSLPGSIVGKIVDDFQNSININEIPMDGRIAVFPKKDMSEICCKQWNANGTISTTLFKPITEDLKEDVSILSSDEIKSLRNDFGEFKEYIYGRFDNLEKIISRGNGRAKKEVPDEE